MAADRLLGGFCSGTLGHPGRHWVQQEITLRRPPVSGTIMPTGWQTAMGPSQVNK